MTRFVVKGEPRGASFARPSSVGGGVAVGPCAGPLMGPEPVAGCSRGAGSESGSGAGATAWESFVNSILVAIEVLRIRLRALHLAWTLE